MDHTAAGAFNFKIVLQQLVQLNERRLSSGAVPPLEVTRSRVAMLPRDSTAPLPTVTPGPTIERAASQTWS